MSSSLVFRLHQRGPQLLREVLLDRGWEEFERRAHGDQDWNLYWRGSAFHSTQYHHLMPWQRLNHHPKTAGITRKDSLARHLRRMKATFGSSLFNFSPTAFILPNHYTRFLEEFTRGRRSRGAAVYWICKPVDLSRGRGIFLFRALGELVYDGPVVVQRYVSSPLLISGYKFDLRLYVCVTSFHPLTVYVHQGGLVRFATEKYDLSSLDNLYAHLTNTSINKSGPFYHTDKGRVGRGCKWTLTKFRHFLCSQEVDELLLWQRINTLITLTLLAVAPSVPACANCTELFGFDVLVDVRWKPWLLEVNASPALSLDCQADVTVKRALIDDLIDLMNYTAIDGLRQRAYRTCTEEPPGAPAVVRGRRAPRPELPVLRPLRRAGQTRRPQHASDHQTHLPPVAMDTTRRVRAGAVDAASKPLSLGPQSRTEEPTDRPTHTTLHSRDLRGAEGPNWDQDEGSCGGPGGLQMGRSFRRPNVSWKRTNICRETRRPVGIPEQDSTGPSQHQVPPPRVGDFIRTFPFNSATLRASQHQLDVGTIIQELQKVTARLGSRGGGGEAGGGRGGAEDFDSLLWGPRDPPLLSQFLRPP